MMFSLQQIEELKNAQTLHEELVLRAGYARNDLPSVSGKEFVKQIVSVALDCRNRITRDINHEVNLAIEKIRELYPQDFR
jgi:hypothetical protein